MARGWESKSVESQQEDAQRKPAGPRLSPEARAAQRKREGLLLTQKRFQTGLANATSDRHRQMLEQALAEIEAQLHQL